MSRYMSVEQRPLSQVPVLIHRSSAELGWRGLSVSLQQFPAMAAKGRPQPDELIVLHRTLAQLRWKDGRRWVTEHTGPGTVHVLPSGGDLDMVLENDLEVQSVVLSRKVLVGVATEIVPGDPEKISLRHSIGRAKEAQLFLLKSMGAALQYRDPASVLFAEHAAHALAAQLLSDWCVEHGRVMAFPPRSGRSRSVSIALDYMQANLAERLTLETIADAAGAGITTLCRRFRSELGMSPHEALMDLRLKRAQDLLKRPRDSLPDIAALCGFSSQQHMTMAFRNHLGVTPGAYRREAMT